jgi:N-acetylmuramoyl-L-alanine amidase
MLRMAVGILLIGLAQVAAATQARIESVRVWRAPDSTRLVFDLSAPVNHKMFTLDGPSRVVIDVDQATVAKNLENPVLDNTPIAGVRYGTQGSGLRVVLDIKSKVQPRSFLLPKHGDKVDRLVIDLFDREPAAGAPPDPVRNNDRGTAQDLTDLIAEKRDIIIAVDAGHGGEDPGALGPGRIKEKVVVMAISEQLVDMINREPGYKAHLVRTGDYYVPLRTRRDKARQLRADLFVSVHADAFKNPSASGASVFALSRSGATSESARFLAQKENEADLIGGVGGVSLSDVDNVLAGVLVDLSMTATLTHSLQVGDRVLREMGKIAKLHKNQVEQAGFAVLKSPDVPSILVETGFISNPQEAQKLNTPSYRRFMAEAIFKGIKDYFYDTPPAGSYVAWTKSQGGGGKVRHYTIANGDTLSDIAKRHNVSLAKLLEHNGLQSSAVIRVGQKLVIPAS